MPKVIRDQQLNNISLVTSSVEELCDHFTQVRDELLAADHDSGAQLEFIIRYDGQGDILHTAGELLSRYRRAKRIERVRFSVSTERSRTTNNSDGTYLILYLDRIEIPVLNAASNDVAWAQGIFSRTNEIVKKFARPIYGVARSGGVRFLIQFFGLLITTFLSVAAANKYGRYITTENGALFAFIFFFLFLANCWGQVQNLLMLSITKMFPNVEFLSDETRHWHWFVQALIGSSGFVALIWIGDRFVQLIWDMSSGVILFK
jgi:hypothetical protein